MGMSATRSTKLPGLRGARERAGISIRKLSRRSGVAATNISNLERLKQGAYEKTIYKLCEALQCTMFELRRPSEENGSWTPEDREELLQEADLLATWSRALPDELLSYLHTHIVREMSERGLPRYEVVEGGVAATYPSPPSLGEELPSL